VGVAARLSLSLLIVLAAVRLSPGQANDARAIARQTSGSFVFTDPASQHPITVWFCRPPLLATDSRVVFVMHGSESQTARQACDIASPKLDALNALVLAPQFSEKDYPGDSYMFGDMLDPALRIRPKVQWALTAIERLFDAVRHGLALTLSDYDIVGFSGGGQFVHRLVLFVPEARFRRAVAASAGRYAFPSWSEQFPYGLAGSPVDRKTLARAFSRDFIVMLGDGDVADREREAEATTQGANRFARGLRFFATASEQAVALGVPLRWRLHIVHGVDHAAVPMVRAALQLLHEQGGTGEQSSLPTPMVIAQEPIGANARQARVPAGTASLYARDIGKGPPAIVLHGGPDFDTAYLLPSLDRFADIYRLIYYDQRGRGKSADGVQPGDVSLATDLEDVERVRQHFGLEAPTLLGHSWGTVLALEYALRYPNRVSRLVLMNPAPASSADATLLRKAYTSQLGDQMERQRAIMTSQAYQQGDPETVAARYRIHFTHALAKPEHYEALMRAMRGAFIAQGASGILKARAVEDRLMADTWQQPSYDLMPRLGSLRVPTLVLWGDHDFIPREISEHLVRSLPQARLVTLKDCGHFAYLECPGAVRTALREFIRRPLAPR
jgi:proline iminopeptidase